LMCSYELAAPVETHSWADSEATFSGQGIWRSSL